MGGYFFSVHLSILLRGFHRFRGGKQPRFVGLEVQYWGAIQHVHLAHVKHVLFYSLQGEHRKTYPVGSSGGFGRQRAPKISSPSGTMHQLGFFIHEMKAEKDHHMGVVFQPPEGREHIRERSRSSRAKLRSGCSGGGGLLPFGVGRGDIAQGFHGKKHFFFIHDRLPFIRFLKKITPFSSGSKLVFCLSPGSPGETLCLFFPSGIIGAFLSEGPWERRYAMPKLRTSSAQKDLLGEGLEILQDLEGREFASFLVEETVRDLLLHRPLHDLDMVTSAPREVLKSLYPRGRLLGKPPSPVYLVPLPSGTVIEFSFLTSSLEEDLPRRDFTINSLAMDGGGEIFGTPPGTGRSSKAGAPLERISRRTAEGGSSPVFAALPSWSFPQRFPYPPGGT